MEHGTRVALRERIGSSTEHWQQNAESARERTGPGGDTSPAVTGDESAADVEAAEEVVADVYGPDDEVQDDGDVNPEPTAENLAVVDDPGLSPELAAAAAAEIEAAELGDAATAGAEAPGGEAERDPE